ncbi:MAG: hypothetical protein HOV78_20480 [Hamadaea sp.]|nr:hypothetical protein [Hamadaea sp.]
MPSDPVDGTPVKWTYHYEDGDHDRFAVPETIFRDGRWLGKIEMIARR